MLGALALTGVARAQITEAGPYFAMPSWDQQIPAAQRFIILSNWVDKNFPSGGAAVLDRETGLVWERQPPRANANVSWATAFELCKLSTTGGLSAWRLPAWEELASLSVIDPVNENNNLPDGNPFVGVVGPSFWTATTVEDNTAEAYIFLFGPNSEGVSAQSKSGNNAAVWCVRGSVAAQNPQ